MNYNSRCVHTVDVSQVVEINLNPVSTLTCIPWETYKRVHVNEMQEISRVCFYFHECARNMSCEIVNVDVILIKN